MLCLFQNNLRLPKLFKYFINHIPLLCIIRFKNIKSKRHFHVVFLLLLVKSLKLVFFLDWDFWAVWHLHLLFNKCVFFIWIGECRNNLAHVKAFLDKINHHWINELKMCLAESLWIFCQMIFRACSYNNLTKSWEYLPPCQETCNLYITQNKLCHKTIHSLLYWSQEIDPCTGRLFFMNCSLYPKRLSGKCQDIPLSKYL